MRIGVLTTSYPREEGDPAGHFVAGFAGWLAGRGAQVEVVCAAAGGRLFYRGGAVGALRARPIAGAVEAAWWCGRLAATVRRAQRRWDAMVSHWVVPCGLLGAALDKPHLAIAHGSDVELLRRLPGGAALLRQVARRADLVYAADSLRVDGADGRVVPMAIADAQPGDRARGRRALGLGEDSFVALALGRLSSEKGLSLAIDGLPVGITLVLAGEGPERGRLERRAAGRAVRFVGEVRGDAKADLLAACDVVVVPSLRDGSPTVIAEAQAAGRPLVVTRVGGLVQSAGASALVCEPGATAVGAALARVRSDAPLRQSLAADGRRMAAARLWPTVGPRLSGRLADRLPGGQGSLTVLRI